MCKPSHQSKSQKTTSHEAKGKIILTRYYFSYNKLRKLFEDEIDRIWEQNNILFNKKRERRESIT